MSLSPGDEVPHIFTRLLHCRVCKEPLAATDGEYALKYFLVEKANKRNSVIRKAAKLDQAGLTCAGRGRESSAAAVGTLWSGEDVLPAATKEAIRVPQNLRANERIGICAHHNGPRLPTWGPTDNISFRRIARHGCYARRRVRVSLLDIRALPVRLPSIGR